MWLTFAQFFLEVRVHPSAPVKVDAVAEEKGATDAGSDAQGCF